MNISYRWLQSLAPSIGDSPQQIADRLATLGAPVDEIIDLAADLEDVVVARVSEVRQHPNADRLRICSVDAGAGDPLQVVCGAPNVEPGGFYPFAPVGSGLPGGVQIKKAKLRGEVSEGMLCSACELGLGRDHAGLMALAGQWEPGAPFVKALGLDDARLVVDVTPNRPDLLSHLGVAREAAAGGVQDIHLPAFPTGDAIDREAASSGTPGITVTIDDPQGCPRYMAAVVRGVKVGPSPEWLATRLRAVGLRPINNVVDATNYVLFELGQPLHAFDLDRLGGGEVRVRRAAPGEALRTLDGVDRELDTGDLVIADAENPVALAGVMGGAESEVSAATTDILVECARFAPALVRRTARRLGLSTDASYRFERGVDPEGLPRALHRALDLIVAVAGGSADQGVLDVGSAAAAGAEVALRPKRVRQVLGVEIPTDEIASLLHPIGFGVSGEGESVRIQVPSFRPDVNTEIEVIEEIARRRGYDTLVGELGAFRPTQVPEDPLVRAEARLRGLFARWGFLEARTAGFAPSAERRIPLLNPLSAEEAGLRDSLLPGLLRRAEHSLAREVRNVRLFEIGTVFRSDDSGRPAEERRVAAVFTGSRAPQHWSEPAGAWTVWDLKGLLEELAREVGGSVESVGDGLRIVGNEGVAIGSGSAAGRNDIDAPAWTGPVWVLEARVAESGVAPEPVQYRPLPEFPATERDLALLVPHAAVGAEVAATIRDSAGPMLEMLELFDQFVGAGVPEGVRSLAWRLRFRAADRTLTDKEVDAAVSRTLKTLEDRFGIRRR